MFINRTEQLNILESLYAKNVLEIVWLHGEHQVGKTDLIKEFLKKKSKAYFCVRNLSAKLNKTIFHEEMIIQGLSKNTNVPSWHKDLQNIIQKSTRQKMVLVIDQAQSLTSCFPEFLQTLITYCQQDLYRLRLLIIFISRKICSEETEKTLSALASLHKINLKPMTYQEAQDFYQYFNYEDKVIIYGVTGGLPGYLKLIRNDLSIKDNLYNLFFAENALLREEAEKLMTEKFRQPALYKAILHAIALGNNHVTSIAAAMEMECNKLSKYLSVLLKENLIEKIIREDEITEKKQHKNTFYRIKNNFLLFWYRFVLPNQSNIEIDLGNYILRNIVLPAISIYTEKVFQDICLQYCEYMNKTHKWNIDSLGIGFWWQEKDNLFFLARGKKKSILISYSWEKTKVDVTALEELRMGNYDLPYKELNYLYFSRKGFTDKALSYSAIHSSDLCLMSLFYIK